MIWFLCLTLMLCLGSAMAATVESTTEYSLGSVYAKLALLDSYIVLREDNLDAHPEILNTLNTTAEALKQDWTDRGVILQAWVSKLDACLEVRARQDEDAARYYNIDDQTTQSRATYRSDQLKSEEYENLGYDLKSAEWFRTANDIRFLQIKYKRNVNGLITWGYAEKTVRNGWTLVLDYQVFGRGLKERDLNSLRKVTRTVSFTQTMDTPAVSTGVLSISAAPPLETNTASFTVEGTTNPGAHVIGVIMKYANPTPIRIEADASQKTGKFKMNVKLPDEGIWLMTLTVEIGGEVIAEHVFDTTTYQKTLLPLTLKNQVPDQFSGNEFTLAGTTTKGVTLQCIVTGGAKNYDKTLRTSNNGKFSFKIPTDSSSAYTITLILQKKNYDSRRFTWTANRALTEEDNRDTIRAEAVKPAYSTLKQKMDAYTGRVMGYKVYISDIQQVGEEYVVFAAMSRTEKGKLKSVIAITTHEEPTFVAGSEQKFYGRLTGYYEVQSEEDSEKYPSFELLFWD